MVSINQINKQVFLLKKKNQDVLLNFPKDKQTVCDGAFIFALLIQLNYSSSISRSSRSSRSRSWNRLSSTGTPSRVGASAVFDPPLDLSVFPVRTS